MAWTWVLQQVCRNGDGPGRAVRNTGRRQASGLLVKGFKALGGREKQKTQFTFSAFYWEDNFV